MTAGRVRATLTASVAAVLLLAGCGGGASAPPLHVLPLVTGVQIVEQATQCDKGSNAYCALEVVVEGPRFRTSAQLLAAEHRLVHARGWRGVTATTSDENASESPGSKYVVTYGTADGDLRAIELGWIHRSARIEKALARTLFERSAAIDILLETGSADGG